MNPEDEKTINDLDSVSDGDVESPEEVNNSESKLKVLASHEEFASEVIDDDSPFPEVRAAVPSTDDVSLPQNTLRVWVLGLMLTTVGSAMNMLFSLHSPTFTITSFVTSILAYPIGKAWARFVPCWRIFGVSINPGPFNIKEHTLITVMSSVCLTGGAATATQILVAQNKFFGSDFGVAFAICSTLSTQTIGFAMAGITRKALVDSPATGFNYSAYSLFGLFFSGFVKSKWTDWYFKYNYSLSAGLDLGLAYSSLVIFLCLTLPGATFPDWWGNSVINTPDYLGTAVRAVLKEGESFGPSSW
ncbi:hypothetical protein OY671_004424 [Metschnikowia pulcherrima]|nr:hypothetical protein OY671_004424 [Metschnikowia pulcherrima]